MPQKFVLEFCSKNKIKNLVWTNAKPYFNRFINEIKQYESDLNGVRNN